MHAISRRDVANQTCCTVYYRKLRNQVNYVRKSFKTQYYLDQVQYFELQSLDTGCIMLNNFLASLIVSKATAWLTLHNGSQVEPEMLSEVTFLYQFLATYCRLIQVSQIMCVTIWAMYLIALLYLRILFIIHLKISEFIKSSNDDVLSNRLLVGLADVLAAPKCVLINSSIRQSCVPSQRKNARITALPKVNPPVSTERDLRPTSLTSGISKIAESFTCKFFNMHFDKFIDPNQFGCTSNRSATRALVKLTDMFLAHLTAFNNVIRFLFIDFSKTLI